jgi:hypothetical protein
MIASLLCRRVYFMGVLGSLTVGICPASSVAKHVERAESTVEIDDNGGEGRTVNRTFEAVVEGRTKLLLRKEVVSRFASDDSQGHGRVRIDAWRLPRTRGDKPLYTITDQADEIGWLISGRLLTTRLEACCDSPGSRAVFSANTGRLLLYANGGGGDDRYLAMVTREGSVLMLGVLDENGGRHPRALPKHEDGRMVLLVSEADDSTCRRQLVLDLPTAPKVYTCVSSVNWKNVNAPRVNGLSVDLAHGQALSGTLEIVISDERRIAIPVGDKGFDSSRVALPPDTRMKVISPCVP